MDKNKEAIKLFKDVRGLWIELYGEAHFDINGGQDFEAALAMLEDEPEPTETTQSIHRQYNAALEETKSIIYDDIMQLQRSAINLQYREMLSLCKTIEHLTAENKLQKERTEIVRKDRDEIQKQKVRNDKEIEHLTAELKAEKKQVRLIEQQCQENGNRAANLQAELKTKDELLRELLPIFQATGTHHGGTYRLWAVEYMRKYAVRIEQALKGGD